MQINILVLHYFNNNINLKNKKNFSSNYFKNEIKLEYYFQNSFKL